MEALKMAKTLSDLLEEWDNLITRHRAHLVKHKFSNKFAVVSKEVDSLVVEFKTYSGLASETRKEISSLNKQVLANVDAIKKKLKGRITATKQEKEDGYDALDDFCKCITHESHEVKPTLLGKEWLDLLNNNKKNKALTAVADDGKMLSLLKKLLDQGKKLEQHEKKLGTANAFANRKVKGDVEPDLERNMKSLSQWDDKEAAIEVADFLKRFKKSLDVVIY